MADKAERAREMIREEADGLVYSAWQRFSLPWLAHRLDGSIRDPARDWGEAICAAAKET